jgi:simple sugar transport system permease protein
MNRRLLPLTITILLFAAMAAFGAIRYDGFLSPQVFLNLLIDNAFLCIVAVGMTFVILSGGIDLSVGAVIALTTMISASLLDAGWNPYAAMAAVLVLGAGFGALQGFLIQRFNLAPFIVTLGGMFMARGCCYLISTESIPIGDATYAAIAQARIPVGFDSSITIGALLALAVVAIAMRVAHSSEFGRTVFAIGGGESSARLMGLSVDRTKIGVYLLSGFTAALGGIVMTFYMLSGYSLHAVGLELDAIAAVRQARCRKAIRIADVDEEVQPLGPPADRVARSDIGDRRRRHLAAEPADRHHWFQGQRLRDAIDDRRRSERRNARAVIGGLLDRIELETATCRQYEQPAP